MEDAWTGTTSALWRRRFDRHGARHFTASGSGLEVPHTTGETSPSNKSLVLHLDAVQSSLLESRLSPQKSKIHTAWGLRRNSQIHFPVPGTQNGRLQPPGRAGCPLDAQDAHLLEPCRPCPSRVGAIRPPTPQYPPVPARPTRCSHRSFSSSPAPVVILA